MPLNVEPIRVLIVDDEEEYQSLARRVLSDSGISVDITVATDFESALYLVLSEYFDLLILDLVLHGRNAGPQESWEGLWILQELCERGINEHLAIVVLTQFANAKVVNYIWT